MAEIKKYLDTTALGTLVDQIKAEDAKVKAYADKAVEDAGKLYDVAGAAATAETNAKAYTDALANGAVADNTAAIAKLNGDASTEGSVAKAIADAKSAINESIDAVSEKADAAQAAADAAQGEVDALELLVGTLPTGTAATSVVDYVNLKTSGIATDAALGELNNQVSGLQTTVNGIVADYLKAADKQELADAIAAEESRAKGVEGGLETRLKAVEDDYLKEADKTALQTNIDAVAEDVAGIVSDYLKAADKTELEGKIDAKADKTALDAEAERAAQAEAGLQNQINLIMNNPDTKDVIDSIAEFTQYVADHGTIADGFRVDIDKNKEDIAAMDTAYKAADTAMAGRLDVLEAIDHDAYVAADSALKTELEGKINAKADASALTSAIEALEAADVALGERVTAVEALMGDGENSVADMIADSKAELQEEMATAIEGAKTDASNKDAVVLAEAQKASAAVQTALDTHIANGDVHVTTADKAKWNAAADVTSKAHEHSNFDVLEAITAAKVAAWDAAEQAAKTYADGLNTAMTTKVDAIDARVTKNAEDIALKADTSALDAAVARIAKNETDIATNTSAINSFTAITSAEVNAMFA